MVIKRKRRRSMWYGTLHQYHGAEYLMVFLGYKENEIMVNLGGEGYPDLVTNDGKEWEIKKLKGDAIIFTPLQIKHMKPDTNILLMGEPVEILKFEDLLSGDSKYYVIVSMEMHLSIYKNIVEHLKYEYDNNIEYKKIKDNIYKKRKDRLLSKRKTKLIDEDPLKIPKFE